MKATLLADVDTTDGIKTAGTTIEHADALHLVAMGIAEPADDATAREWATWQQTKADAEASRAKRIALNKPRRPAAQPEAISA